MSGNRAAKRCFVYSPIAMASAIRLKSTTTITIRWNIITFPALSENNKASQATLLALQALLLLLLLIVFLSFVCLQSSLTLRTNVGCLNCAERRQKAYRTNGGERRIAAFASPLYFQIQFSYGSHFSLATDGEQRINRCASRVATR